jgi:hypothetical protein
MELTYQFHPTLSSYSIGTVKTRYHEKLLVLEESFHFRLDKWWIHAGDAILLMPCEFHQIRNIGDGMLKMICTVPLFPGKTGKETTPCM